MELIWFIVTGLTVGWLAHLAGYGTPYGTVGDLALGVLGALLAAYLYGSFGGALSGGLGGSIGVATVGAVLLIILVRLFRQR